jgi:hypothetical protein
MSYAPIASTSYTVEEGTYTVEVLEKDATEANNDLLLTEKPRRRTRDADGVFVPREKIVYLRVRDEGRLLIDKLIGQGANLKLKITGPYGWEGPLKTLKDGRETTSSAPVIDLEFHDGISALEGKSYDLSGKRTVAGTFYDLLDPTDGPGEVRCIFDWTHVGQTTSRHSARAIRVPLSDIVFGDEEDQSYLHVLKGLLRQWNCDLVQDQNRWLIRHLKALGGDMTVLDYDGSSYSISQINLDTPVGQSDIVRRLNSTKTPIKRPSREGLGRLSARYDHNLTHVQNTGFGQWTADDSEPLEWTVLSGSVTHVRQGGSQYCELDDRNTELEQASNLAYNRTAKAINRVSIGVRYKIASDASTGDKRIRVALLFLDQATDGTQRYVAEDGTVTTTRSHLNLDFTVTQNNQGTVQTDRILVSPGDGPETAPRLRLLWQSAGALGEIDFLQFEKAVWDLAYKSRRQSKTTWEASGSGTAPDEYRTSLGDHTVWNTRHGVIEFYDGGAWRPARELWTVDTGADVPIHQARLYQLLRHRSQRVYGLGAAFDRCTLMNLGQLFNYQSNLHVGTAIDGKLGEGITRVVAYQKGSSGASINDITGKSLYQSEETGSTQQALELTASSGDRTYALQDPVPGQTLLVSRTDTASTNTLTLDHSKSFVTPSGDQASIDLGIRTTLQLVGTKDSRWRLEGGQHSEGQIGSYVPGKPVAGEKLVDVPARLQMTVVDVLIQADIAPASQSTFAVDVAGTTYSATLSAGSTAVVKAIEQQVVENEVLVVTAPDPADSDLEGISVAFKVER